MGRVSCQRLLPFLSCLLVSFSSMPYLFVSPTSDTIFPSRSISGNQTVVSKAGTFEMGFFTPGNSHNYYVGIWYKNIPVRAYVWVANRDTPLMETSYCELKISDNGNLVIISNHPKNPVWSTNSIHPSPASSVAVLLDTGNLVLTESSNTSVVFWQSFDHPTDTWLPTSWLGLNKLTGENRFITSWKNLEDPAPGFFSYMLDDGGSSEYFLVWNKTRRYWRTGNWTGRYFSLLAEMGANPSFKFLFVDNHQGRYGSYAAHPTIFGRGTVDLSGQLKWWIWVSGSQEWLLIWSAPSSRCRVYSLCGAFSACDEKSTISCRCLHGFKPTSAKDWELNNWSGGCVRRTSLQCDRNTTLKGTVDGFLAMANVQLPDDSRTLAVQSARECESACLSSCNCSAYSFHGWCSIWVGDLLNLQQLSEDDDMGRTLFLRLPASELTCSSSKRSTVTELTLGVALCFLVLVCIALGIAWCHRRRISGSGVEAAALGSLVQFSYSDLKTATKNFSEMLGKGGFGSVYKGMLPDSTSVAVKRLEGLRQGEKQFRSELSILGTVQHVNLVLLRGFCTKGSEKLLVYAYMPNGSLNCHLFGNHLASVMSWKRRFQIILGIARGLAYLHENCREQIIHCDIKPDNILLDTEFCPKVADFGMAKLFGREFSRVLTTMRGTVGYLAPEWISGTAITTKVDVYSYGMMLFEIISGRRNNSGDREQAFFPVCATAKVCEGDVLSIVDGKLHGDDIDVEELTRACRVACWCIQDSEVHRPSMGLVVNILEGSVVVDVPPVPRFLQLLM